MCGIAGYFLPHRPASRELVRKMCDQIVHRGPDDEGVHTSAEGCGIGMRRLSIIDLNTGHQPIANEDESIWIVFNGEIYNYQELRADLVARGHRFRTQTDTEAIVHLYEEYGVEGIARLRGMFAYAIWDSRKRELLLVRDRFGKKPLYYALMPEGIYFGSELKCLRPSGISFEVNPEALRQYFLFSYVPDPLSIFEQVKKVPPASWMTFSANGVVKQGRYWDLPVPMEHGDPSLKESAVSEELRALFDESVRLRMIADVPLGAFLSGGIDSSSVVASMARQSPNPVKTFSIGFEEAVYNELPYAAAVASRYGTEHHTLMVRPDSIDLVERLIRYFDEPFADSSAIPTYLVSQFAAQHVKVVLTGDGGDEVFAGYESFFLADRNRRWDRLPQALRSIAAWTSEQLPYSAYGKNYLRGISRETPLERYFEYVYSPYFLNRHLLAPEWFTPYEEARLRAAFPDSLLPNGADIVSQALYFEAKAKLTGDMLVKVDRMSMANSIEVRCPMLDHRLAELAARIPHSAKMHNGQGKYCFLQAMKDRLPDSVWNRPKRGFSVPICEWMRGPLREFTTDHLTSREFLDRGFVSAKFLKELIDEHTRGRRDNRQALWTMLMLALWFKQWQETPISRELTGSAH